MSFSKQVKDELLAVIPRARHCAIAELAGIVTASAKSTTDSLESILGQIMEDAYISRKVFTLLKKTLNIKADVISITDIDYNELRKALHLNSDLTTVDSLILQQQCCKRAFIRGAFIAAGSISDPNKGYHFEIVCTTITEAWQLMACINLFDIEAKTIRRIDKYTCYVKDGGGIVEMLRIMGASHSVLELENIRIVKEVRGSINRKVNCETANISKTVNTAVRQIEDIDFIDQRVGIDSLPEQLQEMARVRVAYPDTPLGDLGQYLDPPLGKSGVNHRLKKLSQIADSLR